MADGSKRTRVAVLGGGGGALAAAFALTATPALRERFDVTVYQQGWRLGGKGASGRNAKFGQRIEEHGLHIWLGFYDCGFGLMRACYDEWGPPPGYPFRSAEDAFLPLDQMSLTAKLVEDGVEEWEIWNVDFPRHGGFPGGPRSQPSVPQLVLALIERMEAHIDEIARHHEASQPAWMTVLDGFRHPVLAAVAKLVPQLAAAMAAARTGSIGRLLELLDQVLHWLVHEVETAVERLPWVASRLSMVRLALVLARGLVVDVLPYGRRGFDRINYLDLKAWLRMHGADEAIAWGPFVRAYYDLGFAYRGGVQDEAHACGAAGVAVKVLLHMMLGYQGAMMYRMRAGMGETIFTPIKEVLSRRGVRFEFFHRVTDLGVSPDGRRIDRITLWRQARLLDDQKPYQPYVSVNGLLCWPSEPLWEQLVDGPRLAAAGVNFESAWCESHVEQYDLALDRDFDAVVLGISVAALPSITPALQKANAAFKTMLEKSSTVVTQAMQLWTTPSIEELGWPYGPTALAGFSRAFTSWGEMSHLLPMEAWPAERAPGAIEYFCSPMPEDVGEPPFGDRDYPAHQWERVRAHGHAWLSRRVGVLWPRAVSAPGGPLEWARLFARETLIGEARLDDQYFRANVDPTERYVQTLPGSTEYRLDPGASGFDNLVLAGDWTHTRFDCGCFEAAVESGLRAARALTGDDTPIPGDETD